jgi:hypothetical protein
MLSVQKSHDLRDRIFHLEKLDVTELAAGLY